MVPVSVGCSSYEQADSSERFSADIDNLGETVGMKEGSVPLRQRCSGGRHALPQ